MNDTLLAAVWQVYAVLGTALGAAIIAIWGVLSQRATTRRSHTMSHMNLVDTDKDMILARQTFIKEAQKPEGLTPWADPGKEHTAECQAIRLVLNDFELVSVGIQFGIIDYTFYKRYNYGTVIRYWYAAAPFVYSIRGQLKSNTVYHEFEELFRWMENGRPRKRGFWLKKIF